MLDVEPGYNAGVFGVSRFSFIACPSLYHYVDIISSEGEVWNGRLVIVAWVVGQCFWDV